MALLSHGPYGILGLAPLIDVLFEGCATFEIQGGFHRTFAADAASH